MALVLINLLPPATRVIRPQHQDLLPAAFHGSRRTCFSVRCIKNETAPKLSDQKLSVRRRSANYEPPSWDYELLESLDNEYTGEKYIDMCDVLKEQVKVMLDEEFGTAGSICHLELIDDLQRLGISYHFEDKIRSILKKVYDENYSSKLIVSNRKGLYETALEFRLLRQHHFHVPQEVFDCFRCDQMGDFMDSLSEDTKGLLYLYEASFLLTENESTLELSREFAKKNLKEKLEEKRIIDPELAVLVEHAIEIPLHWRMLRLEARWFINIYEKRREMCSAILKLAKLDFNIVQSTHQIDLQYSLRWWKSIGFSEKIKFARDRLVENFFWTIGIIFNPEHGYCRRMIAKLNALITTIDDIYDVYGTLVELELFTDAVERWDTKAIDQLPDYMKICYFALYNAVNEMAYEALKEQGDNIIPYLSKAWADLCKTYLKEVKWYLNGYTPTLQEYLDNAWISISAPVVLVHGYFLVSNSIKKEALEYLLDNNYHCIIRCSSMLLRLSDDLGTSSDEMKRGDVPKSIQCYMKENGASEEEARKYIRSLISKTWKEMNKEVAKETPFSQTFIGIAMNLGRMAQCMYQNGDGHGHPDTITRERILALLFEPIQLVS
ncbi:hypothetical protein M9H77_27184 [Catharanthus roseus]|uniref:Uncharacterized protein n=1 Tax=Catharanthus roseus TaxID=4058 RepID=A0ACC0ACB9_CATRO|nr:hypothetical protein M9H77_27184 [Catharanthus roseus]